MNFLDQPPLSENIDPTLDNDSLNIDNFDSEERKEFYELLYQELSETIYSTLDQNIPDNKKDDLIDSLFTLIVRDMKFDNPLNEDESMPFPINPSNPNFNSQFQNFNNAFNPMFPYQPPPMNTAQQIPQYYPCMPPQIPNSPYQIPNPQFPLPYQQPNYLYSNIASVESKSEKSSKRKKHEGHHSKTKDKEDKKKKDKKDKKKKEEKDEKKEKVDKKGRTIQSFPYTEGDVFNGIMRYLINKTGGNIHTNSTIEITTNSNLSSQGSAHNLVNYNSPSDYIARGGDFYAWICFDFKKMEVEISNYTIKSSHCSIGHLKSWILEVSNDNSNWTTIDEHKNDSTLNGPNRTHTFSTQKNSFSRYCRFRHTGEYWGYRPSDTSIEFNSIEFYGKLRTPKSP